MRNTHTANETAITKSLHLLLGHLDTPKIKSDYPPFDEDFPQFPSAESQYKVIHLIARKVANHFRLRETIFIVEIDRTLKAAAQVEVTPGREIYVRYNPGDILDTAELIPVLAHEIAHVFLDRLGLRFPSVYLNEVLTDVTVSFLGFGHKYLSAQRRMKFRHKRRVISEKLFTVGYITPEEMGFILSIRQSITGESTEAEIKSDYGKKCFKSAKNKFTKRLNDRPFLKPKWWGIFCKRYRRPNEMHQKFQCPICSQKIRLPVLGKKLQVSCPNCGVKRICYS